MFGLKLNIYLSIFYPPEVVGRGSETRLQVGEKLLNFTTQRFIGYKVPVIPHIIYYISYTRNHEWDIRIEKKK